MRVLAIGATGFVGPHVVRGLAGQGHEIAVLHRGRTGAGALPDVRRIHGDRNALAGLRAELERFQPEVVLDMIAYTERQARELVDAFRGLATRLVVASSADVYRNYDGLRGRATAPPDPAPLSEEAPLRETLHPYRGAGLTFEWADDYDKILVERVVLGEPRLPATVLRFPAVYGPGDRQHRIRPYLRRMDAGEPDVPLGPEESEWRWTRGYVENVAAAVTLAVVDHRASGRVYNLGEEPATTQREWVERIARAAGRTAEVVRLRAGDEPREADASLDFRYPLAIETRRIREELGYREPVDAREALERTVRWERALGGPNVQPGPCATRS